MTRYSSSYTTTNTTTAALVNAHFGKFSLALQAVLAKTGDTGQVTFGTTAGSTTPGTNYEVYAFTDSLQATRPIFVRVDYVTGAPSDAYLTVGTGTDGAGNISGQMLTQSALSNNGPIGGSSTAGLLRTVYSSGDGSYASLMTGVTTATTIPTVADNMGAIVIERTRDADGTPNGNGVNIYRWRGYFDSYNASMATPGVSATTYMGAIGRAFDTVSPAYGPDLDLHALLPMRGQLNSYTYLGAAMAYPVYGFTAAGAVQGASKALMAGFINDWPQVKQQVPVSHYGTSMTFLPMGLYAPLWMSSLVNQVPLNITGQSATPRQILCPLFRWE